MMKKIFKIITTAVLIVLAIIKYNWPPTTINPPMAISISSDGRYALSASYHDTLVLWDIKNKTSELLSIGANMHSPYFIKDSHTFIWPRFKI